MRRVKLRDFRWRFWKKYVIFVSASYSSEFCPPSPPDNSKPIETKQIKLCLFSFNAHQSRFVDTFDSSKIELSLCSSPLLPSCEYVKTQSVDYFSFEKRSTRWLIISHLLLKLVTSPRVEANALRVKLFFFLSLSFHLSQFWRQRRKEKVKINKVTKSYRRYCRLAFIFSYFRLSRRGCLHRQKKNCMFILTHVWERSEKNQVWFRSTRLLAQLLTRPSTGWSNLHVELV